MIMTEPVATPGAPRRLMSELLFEAYQVPGVVYGVDALFSMLGSRARAYSNNINNNKINNNNNHVCGDDIDAVVGSSPSGITISCGYTGTHVLPLVRGRLHTNNTRRISVGGLHCREFLLARLAMQNAELSSLLTYTRTLEMLHKHTCVAVDYTAELRRWAADRTAMWYGLGCFCFVLFIRSFIVLFHCCKLIQLLHTIICRV